MGKIKSKVLNAKNGLITEKRFQDLTDVQWIFHYKEIVRQKEEEDKDVVDVVKAIKSYIDQLGVIVSPERAKKLMEAIDTKDHQAEIPNDETLPDFWDSIKENIPSSISVPEEKDRKFFLPKKKVKKGIRVSKEKNS